MIAFHMGCYIGKSAYIRGAYGASRLWTDSGSGLVQGNVVGSMTLVSYQAATPRSMDAPLR